MNDNAVLFTKRSKCLLITLAVLLIFTVGCQVKEQLEVQPKPENKPDSAADIRFIEPVENDLVDNKINSEGMIRLREFSYDVDLDDAEEKVELYVAAEKDAKGEIMWDDGQNWILAVRDGEKSYMLFSARIQLGQVYFAVSKSEENQLPDITVLIPTGSSFSMMGYSFDKNKNGFNEKQLYISENYNWLYNSIPGY